MFKKDRFSFGNPDTFLIVKKEEIIKGIRPIKIIKVNAEKISVEDLPRKTLITKVRIVKKINKLREK